MKALFLNKYENGLIFFFLFLMAIKLDIYSQNIISPKKISNQSDIMLYKNLFIKSNNHLQDSDPYQGWESQPGAVHNIVYNHKGTLFASNGEDGTIKLWDAQNQKLIKILHGPIGLKSAISFSPDDSKIAYTYNDSFIRIIDINSGNISQTLSAPHDWLTLVNVLFSPDGSRLLANDEFGGSYLYDMPDGKFIKNFGPGTNGHPIFTSDGEKIISSGFQYAAIWGARDGNRLSLLKASEKTILWAKLSPDNTLLATCGTDSLIRIWNLNDSSIIRTININEMITYAMEFTPDGKKLLISDTSGISILNISDGKLIMKLSDFAECISFAPDGKTLVYGGNTLINIRDAVSFNLLNSFYAHSESIDFVFYSPDFERIITTCKVSIINFWNSSDFKFLFNIPPEIVYYFYNSPIISNDGKILALISGSGNRIKLCDASTGALLKILKDSTFNIINSIDFSPTENLLAAANIDRTIKLWNPESGNIINTLIGHKKPVNSLSFSADGKKIASCDWDGNILIWRLPDGNILKSFTINNKFPMDILFSPDRNKLAVVYSDNSVCLLDANTGNLLKSFDNNSSEVAFSPDGSKLAVGYTDGAIRIFDINTGNIRKTIVYDFGFPKSICYNKDGTKILAGGTGYKNIRIYDVTTLDIKNTDNVYKNYELKQNYPNPFNPTTEIRYYLPENAHVTLKVYDLLGREVSTLINEKQISGAHNITWDAAGYSSGVYFYRLNTEKYSDIKKMLFIR